MRRYRLVPQAEEDFTEAYDYVYFRSVTGADKLAVELIHAFEHLSNWPNTGHRRTELTELPLLFWPAMNYLVVYDPRTAPIQILAVLHGAQDISRILKDRYPTE